MIWALINPPVSIQQTTRIVCGAGSLQLSRLVLVIASRLSDAYDPHRVTQARNSRIEFMEVAVSHLLRHSLFRDRPRDHHHIPGKNVSRTFSD